MRSLKRAAVIIAMPVSFSLSFPLNDMISAIRPTVAYAQPQTQPVQGQNQNVRELIERLKRENDKIRYKTIRELVKADISAFPALAEALRDKNKLVRWNIAHVIREIARKHLKDPDITKASLPLIRLLNDKSVQGEAAELLGVIANSEPKNPEYLLGAMPLLKDLMYSEDALSRGHAVYAYKGISKSNPNRPVSHGEAMAIINATERGEDPNVIMADDVVVTLTGLGKPVVQTLINILCRGSIFIRESRYAAEALGEMKEASAIPALISAAQSQDYELRVNSHRAISNIGEPAIPALRESIGNASVLASDRAELVYLLGGIIYDSNPKEVKGDTAILKSIGTLRPGDKPLLKVLFRDLGFSLEDIAKRYEEAKRIADSLKTQGEEVTVFNTIYALATNGEEKTKKLNKELNIEFFGRYPKEILEKVYENLTRAPTTGKPLLLVVFAKEDGNGAFYYAADKMQPLRRFYKLLITETDTKKGFYRSIPDIASRHGKIDTIIIEGHGYPNEIHFGDNIDENKEKIHASDKMRFGLKKYFIKKPTIIMDACSTGKGKYNIARSFSQLNARVFAPIKPSSLEEYLLDSMGRIQDVKYRTQRREFDSGRIVNTKK